MFPDGHVVGLAHLTSIEECRADTSLFHGGTALFDRSGLKLETGCTDFDQPLVELSSDLVPPVEGRRVVHHDLAVFGVQVSAARAVPPCDAALIAWFAPATHCSADCPSESSLLKLHL